MSREKARRWTICANCSKVVEIEDEDACDCYLAGEEPKRVEVAEVSELRAELFHHISTRRRLAEVSPASPKVVASMEDAIGVVEEFFDLLAAKENTDA